MHMAAKSRPDGAASRRGAAPREKPELIADELRRLIVSGELDEGDSLGREPDLVERFGVSRPSLREALRILEAEGLISVMRGVLGGVVVHRPDQRMTARTAALVLQSRNVSLADVFGAQELIEPAAVRMIASARNHRRSARRIRTLIAEQHRAIDDPEAYASANVHFHEELVALAGNQTLTIVAEMLNEVVARAMDTVADSVRLESTTSRRRGIRSQERLAALIDAGDADAAEEHWHAHMAAVRRLLIGQRGRTVIDLADHL
jgi:GntR family transcriptional regulator, transcriptional repressor for pyruvate dehydrogenase complex